MAPKAALVLSSALLIATSVLDPAALGAPDFDIGWYTIDGGGGHCADATYDLYGVIGQPDAGAAMTGGDFSLTGGFLAGAAASCSGDIDGNGLVDFDDLLRILAAWGNGGGPEDLDGSGRVDFDDLLIVLAGWGPCA